MAGGWTTLRQMFGDERQDYAAALEAHYAKGNDGNDWADHHVSAYAAAHPWEDWAETWAHYLHMIDLLETLGQLCHRGHRARIYGPQRSSAIDPFASPAPDFQSMVQHPVPLTLLLNSLTRSLGQADAYPLVSRRAQCWPSCARHDMVREAAARFRPCGQLRSPCRQPHLLPTKASKRTANSANAHRR